MDVALEERKKLLRGRLLARRAWQSAETAREWGIAAQRALLAESVWRHARQVALYAALPGELDTTLLLEEAWATGRRVLLPRCRRESSGYMDFVPCAGFQELAPGSFRVSEPLPEIPPVSWDVEALAPDVIVVPGVGFDRRGRRLGYGGGYYDRVLAHPALAQVLTVGLAFRWQLVEAVPAQPWDRPVRALCTEEGFLWL